MGEIVKNKQKCDRIAGEDSDVNNIKPNDEESTSTEAKASKHILSNK